MKTLTLRKLAIGAAAISAVAISAPSFAQGFYIGAGVSQSFVDENGLDDDDTSGKVFGGYQFNDYFGVEAAYYDLGDLGQDANSLELDGVSLAVTGSLPVGSNFSVFAKVGGHEWDADGSGVIGSQIATDSDSDLFYGLGVKYQLSSNLTLRGEYERYEVDNLDLDVATIGISFNF